MDFLVAKLVLALSGLLFPLDGLIGLDDRDQRIIEHPDLGGICKHHRV